MIPSRFGPMMKELESIKAYESTVGLDNFDRPLRFIKFAMGNSTRNDLNL